MAPRWGYVEPTIAFNPFLSFQVVIMALLGGTHRLWGPLLGVIPFMLLWELISITLPLANDAAAWRLFLLIVYVIPNGVAGLIEDAIAAARQAWLQSRRAEPSARAKPSASQCMQTENA